MTFSGIEPPSGRAYAALPVVQEALSDRLQAAILGLQTRCPPFEDGLPAVEKRQHVRIVAASTPLIYRLPELVEMLHRRGFTCDVIFTPTAYKWMRWHEPSVQTEKALAYLEKHFPGLWPECKTSDGI